MEKKRVAVVGFGKMGMLHGALVNLNDKTRLIAVCEKNTFTRNAFKSLMNQVNCYSDYKKMLEKEVLDAVIITTPTFNHYEVAIEAAKKGIALFCEKPLALNGIQAVKIREMVGQKHVPSMVGFSNRFYPTIIKGKEMIDEKEIGEILSIDARMYIGDVFKENSGWRYDKRISGGGVLIDFGIHMIDLLSWYFGDVQSIEDCWTRKLYSKDVEDEAGATLVYENGLKAHFETSWSRAEYRKASPIISIVGDKGEIVVTEQTLTIKKNGVAQVITHPDLYQGTFADIAGINYSLEIQHFIDILVNDDVTNNVDIAHAARVQEIIDDIYSSATEHKEEI